MEEARVTRPDPSADAATLVALARAAAEGETWATTKLLRLVSPRLVSIVRAVLGSNHPDVDDAAQQALIGFVRALPALRGENVIAYGKVIAVRTAIATRRRARKLAARVEDAFEMDTLPDERPDRVDPAAARRKEALRELLAELPEDQAEALALRVVVGCSLSEVSVYCGVPLNTVRSRVRLAKTKLEARIKSDPVLLEVLEVEP